MSSPFSWNKRQLRAQQLSNERSHAAELLEFYAKLLEIQQALHARAEATWYDAVRATAGGLPRLRLGRLPTDELLPGFQRFLADVRIIATDVLAGIAQSLETASRAAQANLLRDFLAGNSPDNLPTSFFPRAYLQPLVHALAEHCEPPQRDEAITTCPLCGWPPHVSAIRDEPQIKGRRFLICSLCGHWWPARRVSCAKCLETHAEKLIYHEHEAVDYIRIEECTACTYYIKAVDLRQSGVAVPDVDDVATVELDLWAQERGLTRIYRNVLGL